MNRISGISAVSLAALLTGLIAAGLYAALTPDPQQPSFDTAQVRRGTLLRTVDTVGRLKPLMSVEVSSQISGLVTEVTADYGAKVGKGQVLARIDPATYEQKLRQAGADLSAAQAAHALNEVNIRRLQGLLEADLATQQDYDQASALLRQSQANLLTRQAAVENARLDLERCAIISPVDGIVIFRQVEVGKTVVSSFSAPILFVIARDLTRMQIIAPINEVDVWSVAVGQAVTFTVDALAQREFSGRITQIRDPYTPSDRPPPTGDGQPAVVTFDAAIEVENPDLLLRSSLSANVSILLDKRENVLLIPNGALHLKMPGIAGTDEQALEAGSARVYRLRHDSAKRMPERVRIRIGLSDGAMTEVVGGLAEGDRVIVAIPAA